MDMGLAVGVVWVWVLYGCGCITLQFSRTTSLPPSTPHTRDLQPLFSLQATAGWRCTTWPVNQAASSRRSSATPPSLPRECSTSSLQDVSIRRQPTALTLLQSSVFFFYYFPSRDILMFFLQFNISGYLRTRVSFHHSPCFHHVLDSRSPPSSTSPYKRLARL